MRIKVSKNNFTVFCAVSIVGRPDLEDGMSSIQAFGIAHGMSGQEGGKWKRTRPTTTARGGNERQDAYLRV
jgi:hypothetical protein